MTSAVRRISILAGHVAAGKILLAGHVAAGEIDDHKTELIALKEDLTALIDKLNCNPIFVRLAWHDSGTFDQRISTFPERGGANGGIVHDPELTMGANAGLAKAINFLKPLKKRYPLVSWADTIQMASACAIEHAGGPEIDMKYGRVDIGAGGCAGPKSREGFADNAGLPDAKPPFGCGAETASEHLRNVFTKKMGFSDQDIVALSGAHTLGRAFKERSGACPFGYSEKNGTRYTNSQELRPRMDGKAGLGMGGGGSWTKDWLTFNNSYFLQYKAEDPHLLWFPTDEALHTDPTFKPFFVKYGEDQGAFFKDYAAAHKKLSELGSKWEPAEGIKI